MPFLDQDALNVLSDCFQPSRDLLADHFPLCALIQPSSGHFNVMLSNNIHC